MFGCITWATLFCLLLPCRSYRTNGQPAIGIPSVRILSCRGIACPSSRFALPIVRLDVRFRDERRPACDLVLKHLGHVRGIQKLRFKPSSVEFGQDGLILE